MRLSEYAKEKNITYQTAWFMFDKGKLKGYKLTSGTIIITEDEKSLEILLKDIKNYCEDQNSLEKYYEIKKILEC